MKERFFLLTKLTKHFQSAHAQYSICISYLQLIDICMQLFADELTNQNREYYKVNDNFTYLLAIDPLGKYVYMKNVGKLFWRSQGQNMSGNMNNSLYVTDVYMSL